MRLLIGPFRPRESKHAAPHVHILNTLAQTAIIWALFLFVGPTVIVLFENRCLPEWAFFPSPVSRALGATLFILASAGGLWSGITMAALGDGTPLPAMCARRLVVAGPYQYVRNPMAVTGISQAVAVGVYTGSPLTIAYAVTAAFIWELFFRPGEEEDLAKRFGRPYEEYRRALRCWMPRIKPYRQGTREAGPPAGRPG
ncbi:MAG: isoprenylcysteine carboxylmethyltransferase family protein [Armatimonadetes bacterium]|nr:isoprenylcysteine carboxylmethyltransferase family protein [Armatimonadota bacterium]